MKHILHYEGHPPHKQPATFEQVNAYHKSLGFPKSSLGFYIGYNYWVERDGTIKQGRIDGEKGAHTIGHNNEIGTSFSGNLPTLAQKIAIKAHLIKKYEEHKMSLKDIGPHRQFQANRTCYGPLPDDWAMDLVVEYLNIKLTLWEQILRLWREILFKMRELRLGAPQRKRCLEVDERD